MKGERQYSIQRNPGSVGGGTTIGRVYHPSVEGLAGEGNTNPGC
jgi:hypothetical protein